jgi:hypothetical protein
MTRTKFRTKSSTDRSSSARPGPLWCWWGLKPILLMRLSQEDPCGSQENSEPGEGLYVDFSCQMAFRMTR